MKTLKQIIREQTQKMFINEKYKKGESIDKSEIHQAADLATKETSDKARDLVKNDFINLSAVAQAVDTDASSNQSAQSSVRKEVLGLGSDGKPDGKPMRADYARKILKMASQL